MTSKQGRISQSDLTEMLQSAVSLEQQRIVELNAESVAMVAGGVASTTGGSSGVPDGTTMGYFPPPTEANSL